MRAPSLHLARGLLLNIIRMMRLANRQKGSSIITSQKKHTLLIIETENGFCGWLLVCVSYKPLRLSGWKVDLPKRIRESFPICVKLRFDDVGNGCKVPAIETFEKMLHRMLGERVVNKVHYSLPGYALFWDSNLRHLHLEPGWKWIPLTQEDLDENINDVDNDEDDDEHGQHTDGDDELPIDTFQPKSSKKDSALEYMLF